jgi:hypothetical protein
MRASTSAGPAVSRMTSSIPQSALNAVNPPSVVIAMIGQPTPVECRSFVSDLTAGRSRRASIKTRSTSGASTRRLLLQAEFSLDAAANQVQEAPLR